MKLMFGMNTFHHGAWINGWIPKPLVLPVTNGKFLMKFNMQTYNFEGKMNLIQCLAEGEVAKQLYETYHQYDAISVFGQLHNVYNPNMSGYNLNALYFRVLSFSVSANFINQSYDAELPKEKREILETVMKDAYDYLAREENKPSQEQIEFWARRAAEYGKKKGK